MTGAIMRPAVYPSARRAPLWLVVAILALTPVVVWFYSAVVAPGHWLTPISKATHGLINSTLLFSAAMLVLEAGVLIIGAGRLRPSDIGLRLRDIGPAVAATIVLWLVLNLGVAGVTLMRGEPLTLDPSWAKPGATVGKLLAQLFGNALNEEVLIRGFLTVQFIILLRRIGGSGAIVLGVVLAQTVFALLHIPFLHRIGTSWPDMPGLLFVLFAFGVMLAAIYLVTRNLFMAVGAHALDNALTLVTPSTFRIGHFDVSDLSIPLMLVAALIWWAMARGKARMADPVTDSGETS